MQIDAAINSGNSGGPAINDKGKCVGIAFQSLKHEDVENIGYVIPTPVIMHFIQDYEKNGAYTGVPECSLVLFSFNPTCYSTHQKKKNKLLSLYSYQNVFLLANWKIETMQIFVFLCCA